MTFAERVTRMEDMGNTYNVLVGKTELEIPLG